METTALYCICCNWCTSHALLIPSNDRGRTWQPYNKDIAGLSKVGVIRGLLVRFLCPLFFKSRLLSSHSSSAFSSAKSLCFTPISPCFGVFLPGLSYPCSLAQFLNVHIVEDFFFQVGKKNIFFPRVPWNLGHVLEVFRLPPAELLLHKIFSSLMAGTTSWHLYFSCKMKKMKYWDISKIKGNSTLHGRFLINGTGSWNQNYTQEI